MLAHSLAGCCIVCYNLEMVVQWLSVFKFPAIAHACTLAMAVYAFSWKRVVRILILHLASHQSAKSKNSLVLLELW